MSHLKNTLNMVFWFDPICSIYAHAIYDIYVLANSENSILFMKILVVNRNYFITGGPEKYMFTLMENMPQHRFIPFCVAFEKNLETPYSRYFVPPPPGQGGVYYRDFNMSIFQKTALAFNQMYYLDARRRLERLIINEHPHVVLCLNAVHFSDSIIDACRRHHVPIIWRLSDFHKICASYLLYRDGRPCDECLERGLYRAVVNRCGGYQRSRAAACIKVTGMWLSRVRRLYDHVDCFVAPSEFTRQKMIQGGFAPEKVVHVPTMTASCEEPTVPSSLDILFVGRLSPEKGVETLLAAFGRLNDESARLSIVGDDTSDYALGLKAGVPDGLRGRITFHGFQDGETVGALYERAFCLVVPSVCYENQPNTVLEGMAHARPAVVSDLGSLSEMVDDGVTGFRFEAGNASDLAARLDSLLSRPREAREMGKRGREHVLRVHDMGAHLASMDRLFAQCVERRRGGALANEG